MIRSADNRVRLDRDEDVWVGRFPGLGSVRVSPDGQIDVEVECEIESDDLSSAAPSPLEDIERALHFGWGEPLSLVRRGFVLAEGVALVSPGSDRCVLVHGEVHDTSILVLGLAARGWTVLADRVVPLEFGESSVEAHPRSAPFLVAKRRAETTQFVSHTVRRETNTVAVEVDRANQPHALSALVSVRIRRPNESVFEILSGHDRFDSARKTLLGGVLAPSTASPEDSLRRSLRLASMPCVALRLDTYAPGTAIDALTSWWDSP